MQRQDWTLLVLCAAHGEPMSPIQLQKALFYLGMKRAAEVGSEYYVFVPYNYGPFAQPVYADAELLETAGLVSIRQRPGQRWNEYMATPDGMAREAQLRAEAPPEALAYLDEVVPWVRRLTFEELVSTVYSEYPSMRENSVFRGSTDPRLAAPSGTPEGEVEQQASRAELIREQTLRDPQMLALLEQARLVREGHNRKWTTFDELDAEFPAEA